MYIFEFHDHALWHEKVTAFLAKMIPWTLWPWMTPVWPLTHNKSRGSQDSAQAWVTWSCYVKTDVLDNFWQKWSFDPCDPIWPQIYLWPHKIDRWSRANVHVWVLCSSYLIWVNCSIFGENDLLTPVTTMTPD